MSLKVRAKTTVAALSIVLAAGMAVNLLDGDEPAAAHESVSQQQLSQQPPRRPSQADADRGDTAQIAADVVGRGGVLEMGGDLALEDISRLVAELTDLAIVSDDPAIDEEIAALIASIPAQPDVAAVDGDPAIDQEVAALVVIPPEQAPSLGSTLEAAPAPVIVRRVVSVKRGQTLMGVITGQDVPRPDAHSAIAALEQVFDPRRLQIGQEITFIFNIVDDTPALASLELSPEPETRVIVTRNVEDHFDALAVETELETRLEGGAGVIQSNLYLAAGTAGIPDAILAKAIRTLSFEVDFQRDIRRGDTFAIMYEADYTNDGAFAQYGRVVYAAMTLGPRSLALYRFETDDGGVDYFDRDGNSVRRALMRTPIDGARLSSSFGMRRHPVLGYSRMHRGTDFAAPSGTPIYAAGNGVTEQVGSNGSYGRYIRIRHNGGLKTAYAHLSSYARGLGSGDRVEQGQVIGYVGASGRSTGPHLHYEVLVDGSRVNPMDIELPTGRALAGDELARFQQMVAGRDTQYAALTTDRADPQVADSAQ